ncbi:DUF1064 domain-containing protein [Psychrobacter sp. I-STPA10]|uniref:DUF1064 domain-containing protein n=1 Tax=Psychrobacter sp. I-STPA10 TaxID=2585769 RepID=UPI001E5FDAC6|nr:DUF1064 domain-containing protein [Psychrobacter sp. I-STPA10]
MARRGGRASLVVFSKNKDNKKSNKYGAEETVVDGIKFHSKKEATRYSELKSLLRNGKITDLELQPKYDLIPTTKIGGKTYCKITYSADFKYKDSKGAVIIEDVKSVATKKNHVYQIKKRLMKTVHGIEVVEV